ncbi:MAG: hypothetical protein J3R72DRAFT_426428 [Linnemannia gamsii]|nr:MAG: hypothetical protein J3R72DRAFT_426428 [Linnemannia gamsii]
MTPSPLTPWPHFFVSAVTSLQPQSPSCCTDTLLAHHDTSFGNTGFQRPQALVRILLSNISDSDLHSAWAVELGFDTTHTYFNSARFSYLGHFRRLDLVQFVFTEYDAKRRKKGVKNYSEDKLKYLHGKELQAKYQEHSRDACCTTHSTMDEQLIRHYFNVFYRETMWSFATPTLGQVSVATRLRSEGAVKDMVQFVEDHRMIFPGCLKVFSTTGNIFWST